MFYRSAALLQYPLGVVAYLLVALYVYMILRSTENLIHFIYLPAFGVLMVQALRRRQEAVARRQAPPRARGGLW
jgi:hypothetical protein